MTESGSDDIQETRAAASEPPRTFASGRYVVRRILGEGGQKVVYLVHDEALDRECALSLIKSELVGDADRLRLRREAQAMAHLGAQSNIVTVFDFGEEDGKPYLVCEYVPAGDLQKELRDAGGSLPPERALALAEDITRGLVVAHSRGVIHRDLKPANVLLCDDGSAKLGDFGLAFSLDRSRLTMAGTVMGTAAYLAPEQALAEPVTERSDLYSLGALLYEMLCGRPPFTDENAAAVIAQQINARPSAPSEYNPHLPRALDALVLRLLAKAPEERPPSAAAVGEELRRIAGDLPPPKTPGRTAVSPPPVGHAPERGLRRLWANRAVRVAAAVLALGVVGAGVVVGLFVSGAVGGSGDPPAANAYQRIDFHTEVRWTLRPVGGDCESTDLVLSGQASADSSGDFTGLSTGPAEATVYASDNCLWGYSTLTLPEQGGNMLSIATEVPITVGTGEGLGFLPAGVPVPIMYTGGTGIYEGATGHGRCVGASGAVNTNPDGDATVLLETDCTGVVAIGPDAAGIEPVMLELGAGLIRMTVFSSAVDLPKKAYFSVLYMNTRNEPQTGLSLKLPAPDGAEMRAAERGEEEPAAGERVWTLPDLAPREVGRFQFSVQFLSAESATVDLVAEIDGDGFDHPSRSDPLAIEVVQ